MTYKNGAWMALLGGLLAGPLNAAAPQELPLLDGRTQSLELVDALVNEAMNTRDVPGLGVAIIHDGRVAFTKSWGQRSLDPPLPLRNDTVMYGASLTKATFAYLVMQLVDEKKITLDAPIGTYLAKPLPEYGAYADLAGDARWNKLTFRILLNHTSGFANFRWIEPDKKLRFHFDPGTRYAYSGEGLQLAQFVLEEGLKLDVGKEMQSRIFDRFGMMRTSMTWRDDFSANFAQGYTESGELQEHSRRRKAGAAGSMDTSLGDWASFLAVVARGEGLSKQAKYEMIRRTIVIDSARQFPTLSEARTDRWAAIGLGYAVGWGVFETPYGLAFFKEGHDDGTANYAVCIAERRDCILLMSNSTRAEAIFVSLVHKLFGDIPIPAEWEGYGPG
ncbi:MAG TPA: serine hydrolase domain-containing protein [Steroidobacteraceae bacterium]|jgi:CubicO group peptidase (beta-lactamase class C family)|nr:serine hydrolase domain-containing protein [Steroidobacteraceae bacterium]